MKITLGLNIDALRAERNLARATREHSSALTNLASGQRINKASDDAAGLAIAEALRSQSKIANTAIRNISDGQSYISIGDSALEAVSSILQRMAELAEQAANGVYSTAQRSPLQKEFEALGSEIERISKTTQFNGIKILESSQKVIIQVGFNSYSNSRLEISALQGRLQDIGLAQSSSSALSYSISGNSVADGQGAARTALAAITEALQTVNSKRGLLGANESRLSSALNNLTSAKNNLEAAESRIRSADIAVETAKLLKTQIQQQTATAILAQANISQRRALDLLSI